MSADSSIVCFFVCFIVFGCELICGRIIFCNSAGINEGYVLSEIIWLESSPRAMCHWGCYQSMTGLAHFNVLNYYRSCRFNSPTCSVPKAKYLDSYTEANTTLKATAAFSWPVIQSLGSAHCLICVLVFLSV